MTHEIGPHIQIWQVAMAKAKSRSSGAPAARPTLAPRTRQELAAIRGEAQKLEEYFGTGTIHAIRYTFTGNKLEAEIRWDHDRANRRASVVDTEADEASMEVDGSNNERAAEGSQRRGADQRRAKQAANKAKAPSPPPGANKQLKEVAKRAERTIKQKITAIVHSLGGDAESGGRYLAPAPPAPALRVTVGDHVAKFRFPIGSPAANTPPEVTGRYICDYLRGGGDPDTPSKELIDFLKPPNAGGESGDMLLQPLFADTAAGAGSAASLAGPSGSAHAVTGGAAGGSAPTFFGYNRHAGA